MSRLQEAMNGVRANPGDASAWLELGNALREGGELAKAKESYQRALRIDPLNEEAQQGLAATLLAERPPPPPRPVITPPDELLEDAPEPEVEATPELESDEGFEAAIEVEPVEPPPPFEPESVSVTATQATTSDEGFLRPPPPRPARPSQGRIAFGILLIGLILFLCTCALIWSAAQLIA